MNQAIKQSLQEKHEKNLSISRFMVYFNFFGKMGFRSLAMPVRGRVTAFLPVLCNFTSHSNLTDYKTFVINSSCFSSQQRNSSYLTSTKANTKLLIC